MTYDPSPYRARGSAADARGLWRNVGKWSVALALFAAIASLLTSLQLFQVTAEGASTRTLRRSVAALTEIDPLLDRNYDELRRSAENAGAGETVALRDFPIAIALQPSEVLGTSKERLRDMLLDRSAEAMYERGSASLRAVAAKDGAVGRFSMAGATSRGLGFLRGRNHDILAVTTFVLAAVCAALAVTLVSMCRGFGRLTGIGSVIAAASIPVVLGGVSARLYMRIASNGDTEFIQREFLEIGQGLAWIPIRDGAAFAILGVGFLVVGGACAIWADRRDARPASVSRP